MQHSVQASAPHTMQSYLKRLSSVDFWPFLQLYSTIGPVRKINSMRLPAYAVFCSLALCYCVSHSSKPIQKLNHSLTSMMKFLILALTLLICSYAANAEKNAWFYKSSKLLLSKELNTCHDYRNAGNIPASKDCVSSKLNAYDLIRQKMDDPSISPLIGESVCVDKIRSGFEYGARCMIAATEICKQDSAGNIVNVLGCLRSFSNPGWQSNLSAMKLDFSKPIRSEEEIGKYVQ